MVEMTREGKDRWDSRVVAWATPRVPPVRTGPVVRELEVSPWLDVTISWKGQLLEYGTEAAGPAPAPAPAA
jgi:hypothetical protein